MLVSAALPAAVKAGSGAPSIPLRAIPLPTQAPAREAVAPIADGSLWYWDTGGPGEAVILLHPMTGSGKIWGYQQPVLARAGYRVIGYSRRGYVGSSAGDQANPGTAANDLLGLVDHLRIDRFHAVGSAGGAFVAAAFAVQWPQRLRSLTLACSIVRVANAETDRLIAGLDLRAITTLAPDQRELGPSYRALNPSGRAAWLDLEHHSRGNNPPFEQPAGVTVTAAMMRGLALPTLLMAGDADLIAPPPVVRSLQALIPGAELAILTESGHSGYWERPDQFNAALLDFLDRRARALNRG